MLIIFISVILVAAIAAGVLLGTGGSLQQKALTTGKQTQREVSGGITVITVSATDGSDGSIEQFEMTMKLAAGSDPIAFDDAIVSFDTKNTTQGVEYGNVSNSTHFNVTYLKRSPEYKLGYLSRGDMVRLTFNTSRPITENELIRTRIIPQHGIIVPVDYVTPDVITQRRIMLYP